MKPRISVITLGVSDLEKSVTFYKDGLGLPTDGIVGKEFEYGAVAFFELQSGLRLALWPKASIAHDVGIDVDISSRTEMTLGYNVNSKNEVDEIMELAKDAGGKLIKNATDTFWGGYAGYFADLDDHLWEVVWNPDIVVE